MLSTAIANMATWYTFTQTQDQIAVSFNLPLCGPSSIQKFNPIIVIQPTYLSATINHPDWPSPVVFIQGELFDQVIPEESLWQLEHHTTANVQELKTITIHLEKKNPALTEWPLVITNTHKSNAIIDSTSLYYSGVSNTLVNPALSKELFSQGAQLGSVACMLKLASICVSQETDNDLGMAWYQKASNSKCTQYNAQHVIEAHYILASAYQNGHFNVSVQSGKALECYQEVISLSEKWLPSDNPDLRKLALFQAGLIQYQENKMNKAYQYWEQGSLLDHPQSLYNLGVMYLNGIGTSTDSELGLALMQRGVRLDPSGKLKLPDNPSVQPMSGPVRRKRRKGGKLNPRSGGSSSQWIQLGVVTSVFSIGLVFLLRRLCRGST